MRWNSTNFESVMLRKSWLSSRTVPVRVRARRTFATPIWFAWSISISLQVRVVASWSYFVLYLGYHNHSHIISSILHVPVPVPGGGTDWLIPFSPGIKSPANKISDFGTPCFQCSQSPCKHLQSEILMTISAQFNFNSVKESTVGVRSPISSLQCPINTSGAAGFCFECLLVQRETKPNQTNTKLNRQNKKQEGGWWRCPVQTSKPLLLKVNATLNLWTWAASKSNVQTRETWLFIYYTA